MFALLAIWLFSDQARTSTRLLVLFLYSFPSEFLVGLVPHEPVLIYFGSHHAAWVVALVAGVGTVLAEAANYRFFSLLYEVPSIHRMSEHRVVAWLVGLFARRPFTAIVVAGFTPVPFFPIRLLVVMTKYPLRTYLLGVFVSRTPRFWLLATLGAMVAVPTGALMLLFGAMLATVNLPALFHLLGWSRVRTPTAARTPRDAVGERE
ncbi:MAG TPA: VTT domain-containing protein [Longimicrobiales bacterium]|nr:VTT domain-containing protein [Longimicrobiales bacterium]